MRTFFLAISLFFSAISFAQPFEISKNYQTKDASTQLIWSYNELGAPADTAWASIVTNSDTSKSIITFPIKWTDTYDSTFVYEYTNPDLKNVVSLLKVQVEYAACCYDIHAMYFLITISGDVIQLPDISYVTCDFPIYIEEMLVDPASSCIHKVINYHANANDVEQKDLVETLYWDGQKLINPH